MTLQTTGNKITYSGNGASTNFPFTFKIPTDSLIVYLTGLDGLTNEVNPLLYTVSGLDSDTGGSVTYPTTGSPMANGYQLTIAREVDYTQKVDLNNQGAMYPKSIEGAFDKLTMQIQQIFEKTKRALSLSITDDSATDLPSVAARANKFMAFDSLGNPTVAAGTSADLTPVSSFMNDLLGAANDTAAREILNAAETLSNAPADTIFGNPTGSTAAGVFASIKSYIARIGNTRGDLLRRGVIGWETYAIGTSGYGLISDGTDLGWGLLPIGENYRNLKVQATTNTAVTCSADFAVLTYANNVQKLLRGVNLTLGTGVSGANGLDTGTVANSTFYSVWIIAKDDGTVAGLLSLSATSPTMPTGYTCKLRVGYVVTNASGALLRTLQFGRKVQYQSPRPMLTGVSGSIVTPTWTAIPTGNFVPQTAAVIAITINCIANSVVIVNPNALAGTYTSLTNPCALSLNAYGVVASEFILESSNIYYASNNFSCGVYCTGWTDIV